MKTETEEQILDLIHRGQTRIIYIEERDLPPITKNETEKELAERRRKKKDKIKNRLGTYCVELDGEKHFVTFSFQTKEITEHHPPETFPMFM